MLNAQQILEEGLLKLENSHGKPAQVGYDLSLREVNQIGYRGTPDSRIGKVLKDKTELATYTPIELKNVDGARGWFLYPGAYDITFNEGCKIPEDRVGLIRQRSSMLRNGTVLHSSVFDPGFETTFMGTVMVVNEVIFIEENARVAQIYFHPCVPVAKEDLYNGQWQGDTQRNK